MAGEKVEVFGGGQFWARVWLYGPLVAWLIFIFFASTGALSGENTSRLIRPLLLWLYPDISEEKIALAHFVTRKLAHFLEYGVLAFLAARALSKSSSRHWLTFSLLLVVLYSLTDEYHQSFVPSRGASLYDSLIDTLGGLTSLMLYYAWRSRRERREGG
ncbi:MAG TPA: VanZ family protein [Pyrinomonadaceae bacterium]|nr:VanZ family protein [Pyrinomonadaceae bacterium]